MAIFLMRTRDKMTFRFENKADFMWWMIERGYAADKYGFSPRRSINELVYMLPYYEYERISYREYMERESKY